MVAVSLCTTLVGTLQDLAEPWPQRTCHLPDTTAATAAPPAPTAGAPLRKLITTSLAPLPVPSTSVVRDSCRGSKGRQWSQHVAAPGALLLLLLFMHSSTSWQLVRFAQHSGGLGSLLQPLLYTQRGRDAAKAQAPSEPHSSRTSTLGTRGAPG